MSKLTKAQAAAIQEALGHALALADVEDHDCTVPADVKEAARLYVESWIIEPLVAVLYDADPELPSRWDAPQVQTYVDFGSARSMRKAREHVKSYAPQPVKA